MKKPIHSSQVEIKLEDGLINFLHEAKNGSIRLIKLVINKRKELALDLSREVDLNVSDWRLSYDKLVLNSLDSNSPCFLFYRLDERNKNDRFSWLFIQWSPSSVPNKQRTIYALAKPTVLNRFTHTAGPIREEIFASDFQEVSLNACLSSNDTSFKKMILLDENQNEFELEPTFKQCPDLQFPIDSILLFKLDSFNNDQCDFIQIKIDLDKKCIILDKAIDKIEPELLDKQMPVQYPSFNLYRYKQCLNNIDLKSVFLIFKISNFYKESNLYLNLKTELTEYLGKSVNISKLIEIEHDTELNEEFFKHEINLLNLNDQNEDLNEDLILTRAVPVMITENLEVSYILSTEENNEKEEEKKDELLKEISKPKEEEEFINRKNERFNFNGKIIYVITCGFLFLSISFVGFKLFSNGSCKK